MTAQPQGETRVLKAFVFVITHGDNGHTVEGCIATSHEEARAIMESHFARFPQKVTLFDIAFAVMQPAMIEWWEEWREGRPRFNEKGHYAFLKGMFFCQCGDHQKVAHCKEEKTSTGWTAIIYGHNHYVKPL